MFLKKIVVGTAAIAAFGATAAVLADYSNDSAPAANYAPATNNSGFYVTGAAGYSWAAKDSSKVFDLPGVGTVVDPTVKTDNNNGGFAGRLGVGYNLNQYFGLETGFDLLSPSYRQIGPVSFVDGPISITSDSARVKTSLFAIDLLGKVTLPFDRFFVFADGGGAYVHAKTQSASLNYVGQIAALPAAVTPEPVWSKSSTKSYFRPEIGAGVGYNLTDALAVDVSYQRIFGDGKITDQNYLASINTTMVGLTYKF